MRDLLTRGFIAGWLAFSTCACGDDDRRAIDWNAKDAHRHCRAAIADYPERPAPSCAALHMCANEAVLGTAEQTRLREMIRSVGCAEP